MKALDSFLCGKWTAGSGQAIKLIDPSTEDQLAWVQPASKLGDALEFARSQGGPALRSLTFRARGDLLRHVSGAMTTHREELLDLSVRSGGNTRGDAKFDVDGAMAVLASYTELAERLGDVHQLVDGETTPAFQGSKVSARHVLVPTLGVAIHINAFNFPAWGMIGKAAVAWLAGVPVVSKPATSTSALAHRIAEIIVEAGVLPPGSFQLLMGPVGDLLDHVGPQDIVAFTGSANTGIKVRSHARVLDRGTRVNVEADSLNSVVLGPDVIPGSELFDTFVRDLALELTQKAGQKCTATRRILVPSQTLPAVREVLMERLADLATRTGNPTEKEVRMGPLSTAGQLADARSGIEALAASARLIFGDPHRSEFVGVKSGCGFFLEPILFEASAEAALEPSATFHSLEVFGPVATLLPYEGKLQTAARIVGLGSGNLVATVYSDDREFSSGAVREIGPWVGRLVLAEEKIARGSQPPGCVFPVANHGGPGRAGGGSELGGRRGLELYMQRLAVQAGASQLLRLFEP